MRVFRYIKGTINNDITFNSDDKVELMLVPSSYNCYPDGKSHFGNFFSFGPKDGVFLMQKSKNETDNMKRNMLRL